MLKSFIASWLIYWGLVAALPVHSTYPAVFAAVSLQIFFVALVILGYLVPSQVYRPNRLPDVSGVWIVSGRLIAYWAMWLSAIGFLSLLYDKVHIQGINYMDGLALAREQWRETGVEREGRASSIWSALGYLLGSSYFIALVLLFVQPKSFRDGERISLVCLVFVLVLVNSIITGGRSNFMLLFAFAIASFGARKNASLRAIFPNWRQLRVIFLLAFLVLFYLIYIFISRSQASDLPMSWYVEKFLPYMGLEFDSWYLFISANTWVAEIGHTIILMVGYLTHSLATLAAILDYPTEDKIMVFGNIAALLYKLGLAGNPDTDWFLAGRFPSVPGAIWHQFGLIGFVAFSLMLGVVSFLTTAWASSLRGRHALLPLGLYTMVSSTLLLTPYVFAPDFLSFTFVIIAFIILAFFTWVHLFMKRLVLVRNSVNAL
jgi:hypothetical protein